MIAILGGGISGLSVAFELKRRQRNFVLLEEEEEVGGKIKSIQVDGFTLELGPNTVLMNNSEIKELFDELNLHDKTIFADATAIKNRKVLYQDKIVSLPSKPGDLFKSKLFGIRPLIKLIQEPFIPQVIEFEGEEESLADFVRRRLGKDIYENFVYPFVTGIYAGDPEKMSIDYTLNILKKALHDHDSVVRGMIKIFKEKKKESKRLGLPKDKIFSFPNGLQDLTLHMHQFLKDEVETSVRLDRIIKASGGYILVYWRNGALRKKKVKQIISCLPAGQLARIINWDYSFIEKLNSISYLPAYVSHFAFEKKAFNFSEKAFGILSREKEKAPFLGLLFNSYFFPHTSPKDKMLITVISGGYKQANYSIKSDDDIQKGILAYLLELKLISGEPILENLHRWDKGIPQYEIGHGLILESIESFERENPGFFVLGNFRGGISVSDCIAKGITFARELKS